MSNVSSRSLTVDMGDGKSVKLRVNPNQTTVIAGTKSKTSAIKLGMPCRFEYLGDGDLAPKAECK